MGGERVGARCDVGDSKWETLDDPNQAKVRGLLQGTVRQKRSAWEWYHCKGLGKVINRFTVYLLKKINFDFEFLILQ